MEIVVVLNFSIVFLLDFLNEVQHFVLLEKWFQLQPSQTVVGNDWQHLVPLYFLVEIKDIELKCSHFTKISICFFNCSNNVALHFFIIDKIIKIRYN